MFEVLGPELPLHTLPFFQPQGLNVSLPEAVLTPTLSPGDTRSGSGGCPAAIPGSTGAAKGSRGASLRLTTPEPHLLVGRSESSGKKVSLIPS